jgi:hypothetical protein
MVRQAWVHKALESQAPMLQEMLGLTLPSMLKVARKLNEGLLLVRLSFVLGQSAHAAHPFLCYLILRCCTSTVMYGTAEKPYEPCIDRIMLPCAGLMTLQELQLVKDDDLDADMQKNEALRLSRVAEKQVGNQQKRGTAAKSTNKPQSKDTSKSVHVSILEAAGSGRLLSDMPESKLLQLLCAGDLFRPMPGPNFLKANDRC